MNAGCGLWVRRRIEVTAIDNAKPRHSFEDSRRLTGANRYYGVPAVVLVPLGPAALDGATQGQWIAHVHVMCRALGWPAPRPRVHAHGQGGKSGVMLAFAAPPPALFTATEVNEWAWERAAALHPQHVATDFDLAQPGDEFGSAAVAHFAARADAELSPPLQKLLAEVQPLGLPVVLDDDCLSIGEGSGAVVYPRAALPLAMDVPWARLHSVPKVLVSGSNGKTTTTRLLAAMARAAGLTPGLCGTEGVQVGTQTVAEGDYAGPAGARLVLRHADVQMAVLETARGGLLRRGLAVQHADVAVVTNISADHLGEEGVDSLQDIAITKLALAHALHPAGTLVMNGQDSGLLRVAAQLPHASAVPWALFACDNDARSLQILRDEGGSTCGVLDGELWLGLNGVHHSLGATRDMPLSLANAAPHNIANIAAAALAAALLGWPLPAIRSTLVQFGRQPHDNPGRLQRVSYQGATVLIDYAHNPDGLQQLLQVARALKPRRLALLLGQAGNRDDAAIRALAHTAAAFSPDRIVIKELPLMLRGRALGDVPWLLEQGLRDAVLPAATVLTHEAEEEAAARTLLAWAQPGDVVVLPIHTRAVRERLTALWQV
jgi:cyanophycin synthetase